MTNYDILGISKNASEAEIKQAYRNMVKAFHPDIYSGNEQFAREKTAQINEAYAVLSNAEKKRAYDETIKEKQQEEPPHEEHKNEEAKNEEPQEEPKDYKSYRENNVKHMDAGDYYIFKKNTASKPMGLYGFFKSFFFPASFLVNLYGIFETLNALYTEGGEFTPFGFLFSFVAIVLTAIAAQQQLEMSFLLKSFNPKIIIKSHYLLFTTLTVGLMLGFISPQSYKFPLITVIFVLYIHKRKEMFTEEPPYEILPIWAVLDSLFTHRYFAIAVSTAIIMTSSFMYSQTYYENYIFEWEGVGEYMTYSYKGQIEDINTVRGKEVEYLITEYEKNIENLNDKCSDYEDRLLYLYDEYPEFMLSIFGESHTNMSLKEKREFRRELEMDLLETRLYDITNAFSKFSMEAEFAAKEREEKYDAEATNQAYKNFSEDDRAKAEKLKEESLKLKAIFDLVK